MALYAVEETTTQCFGEPVYRGLSWIYGLNELGVDMRDRGQNLIWRGVLPRNRQTKYSEMVLGFFRSPKKDMPVPSLRIVYEQRPYEFGWLLFAFARRLPSLA